MTAAAWAPYQPITRAERIAGRIGVTLARRALRREFPGVTERRRTAQALAATDRKERA